MVDIDGLGTISIGYISQHDVSINTVVDIDGLGTSSIGYISQHIIVYIFI